MLIGNKSDLNEYRSILSFQAFEFARDNGMSFMETSAKEGNNCAEAFQAFLQGMGGTTSVDVLEVHSFWDTRQDQFTLQEPDEIPGEKSEKPAPVLPTHSDVVQLYLNEDGEKKDTEKSACCPGFEMNKEAFSSPPKNTNEENPEAPSTPGIPRPTNPESEIEGKETVDNAPEEWH